MKRFTASVIILFALTALCFGISLAENAVLPSESRGATNNSAEINETMINTSAYNETIENSSLSNETLTNETEDENSTNDFANVKGRQPRPK